MSTLLSYEMTHGTFNATISDYKEIPAKIDDDNTVIRDAYIEVTLHLSNGESLKTRWYAKRIPYIMRCLSAQLDESVYKLSELLETCRTESFKVCISVDPRYGTQVEYEA